MTTRRRPEAVDTSGRRLSRRAFVERLAEHPLVVAMAPAGGPRALATARDLTSALEDVGGVVHDSNMDSSSCGARAKSLSCIGPVGHAGSHVAYRGEEVLLWKSSNSYSFECSRDQING